MEDHLTKIDQETFHITIKFVFTTRLTPVYFFVILFSATLFAKLLDGPRMNDMADYGGKCMFYGVLNLLYLNNIWPPPSVGVSGTNETRYIKFMYMFMCVCRFPAVYVVYRINVPAFFVVSFHFLILFHLTVIFLYGTGRMQWIFSQHRGYWWPGSFAAGHQWSQCWVCTHAFPVIYGLIDDIKLRGVETYPTLPLNF